MNKIVFFTYCILYTFISSICMAKRCDGTFENESGSILMEISNDTLFIRSFEGEEPLAICKILKVTPSFLIVNSIMNPNENAFQDMEINYDSQTDLGADEATVVNFVLPDTSDDMKINIFSGTNIYSGTTNKGTCSISLNKNGVYYPGSFNFTIEPSFYVESNPEGQFFGVLNIMYPYKLECRRNDIITIYLPSVTESLFNRYFIKGEYIHLLDNGIEWRGDIYKHENSR